MQSAFKNPFWLLRVIYFSVVVITTGILYPQTGSRWTKIDTSTISNGHGSPLYNGDILINTYKVNNPNEYSVFEQITNTWKIINSPGTKGYGNSYLRLKNNAVLLVGINSNFSKNPTYLYNPQTNGWIQGDSTNIFWFSATRLHLLPSGEVLLIGEKLILPPSGYTNKCEIFDYKTLKWRLTDTMKYKRQIYSSVTLPDGRVLVGGAPVNGLKTFEVYNPRTHLWSPFPDPLKGVTAFKLFVTKAGRLLLIENGLKSEEFDFVNNIWREINFTTSIMTYDNLYELDNNNLLRFSYGTTYIHPNSGKNFFAQEIDINTGLTVRADTMPPVMSANFYHQLFIDEAVPHKMGNGKYLVAGGTGYYYVQGDLNGDLSRYSYIYTPDFIAGTEKEKQSNQENTYNIYPNPSGGEFTLSYSLPENTFVSINIYSSMGELVFTETTGYKQKGTHNLPLSLKGKPAGIYACVLQTAKGTKTIKMSVVR